MEKKQFGQFLFEGQVYKKCPDCNTEIKPEWTSAYNDEWCPACGLNIENAKPIKN